jgi:hypothetical protein
VDPVLGPGSGKLPIQVTLFVNPAKPASKIVLTFQMSTLQTTLSYLTLQDKLRNYNRIPLQVSMVTAKLEDLGYL